MRFWNMGIVFGACWGATLGCAGHSGEEGWNEEDEAELVGASSSALHGGARRACDPKKPLGEHCKDCKRTKIGAPIWEPTGVAAIAGQVGSTSPDTFFAFLNELVRPEHAFDDNDFIIGPAVPHAGPYHDELATFAIEKGFRPTQKFKAREFTAPGGIIILLNLVPSAGAPTGSSFDFASGPIIPNAVFPITVDGDLYRNGELYDPFFDSAYAGYPGMNPPIVVDGPSHLPWFFGENSSFGPPNTPVTGNYEFKLKITDSTGAGWNLKVPFTVKK